jgi:hypothetical protein
MNRGWRSVLVVGLMLVASGGTAAGTAAPNMDELLPQLSPRFPVEAIAKLRAARGQLTPKQRKLVDRLLAIVAKAERGERLTGADFPELANLYAELWRSWAAGAPRDFEVQWRATSHIHFLGVMAAGGGFSRPDLLKEGAERARRVLATWPNEAKAHGLVASVSDDLPTQLREFARCRELDPNDEFCRERLTHLIKVQQMERCRGDQLRPFALHAVAETGYDQPQRPTLEPGPITNADIAEVYKEEDGFSRECAFETTPEGTKRLSALTKKVSDRNGWTVKVIDGARQPAQMTHWIKEGRTQVPCNVCKTMTRPPLPPELRRWAQPEPANK